MNQVHITEMPLTVIDWIRDTASRFEQARLSFGHGTDNAWDEAVQAVLFALGVPALEDNASIRKRRVSREEAEKIQQLVKARIRTRKLLPYLTHCAYFMGMSFYVDERVLIPRSPFAEWIERRFAPWIDASRVHQILDIGTGSGCIAIACANVFPNARVDAVDIDKNALAVAAINVDRYSLQDRIRLLQSDCFSAVSSQKYDVIISNPPYIARETLSHLPREYQQEPQQALVAENEGLAIAEQILKQAANYLTDSGILLMEVGYNAEMLQKRHPKLPLMWLEQQRGGEGLFIIDKKQLENYVWK